MTDELIDRAASVMTRMLEDADRLDALLNELGIGRWKTAKEETPR